MKDRSSKKEQRGKRFDNQVEALTEPQVVQEHEGPLKCEHPQWVKLEADTVEEAGAVAGEEETDGDVRQADAQEAARAVMQSKVDCKKQGG